MVSDQEILRRVEQLLRRAPAAAANVSAVVRHLETSFGGVDLSGKASLIRDQIELLASVAAPPKDHFALHPFPPYFHQHQISPLTHLPQHHEFAFRYGARPPHVAAAMEAAAAAAVIRHHQQQLLLFANGHEQEQQKQQLQLQIHTPEQEQHQNQQQLNCVEQPQRGEHDQHHQQVTMEEIKKIAMVVGATGVVGRELVRTLISSPEFELVYGVARSSDEDDTTNTFSKCQFVSCDLLDRDATKAKLGQILVTHLFWVTWATKFQLNTQECSDLNRTMLASALDALSELQHVSLQTGTNHYAGSSSSKTTPCYDEETPRVVGSPNFYYALEDLVQERAESGLTWAVHRPGLVLGASCRSHFNVVGSLCVYASICKHLGLQFLFRGNRHCWEELFMDASDARLIARQHVWRAVASDGDEHYQHHTFNCVNVDAFTWKEVWPVLAAKFSISNTNDSEDYLAEGLRFAEAMGDKGEVWEEIVEKKGLRRTKMEDLANWSFLDVMFRLPKSAKLLVQRPTRAQRLGFTDSYIGTEAFLYWVDRMMEEHLVPNHV